MVAEINVMLPVSPVVFGVFLAVVVIYLAYSLVKVVVSLYTGA